MIIDTHAHYDDEAFDEDRDRLIKEFPLHGIEKVVNIGASIASVKKTLELMNKYETIYAAVGVHPSETGELNDELFEWLEQQLSLPKVVAVGEIGLDYYWDTPERELQKIWFHKQLRMAIDQELPVVIHSRDAAEDTMTMMKEAAEYARLRQKKFSGVIHCYSYSVPMAHEYAKMGFFLGIGGVVTFKNSKKLKEVVTEIPLDYLVLETDCPYLSPEPNRGKRNSSYNLPYVAEEIARLKGITVEEVIEATSKNAELLYPKMKQKEGSEWQV